MRNFSILVCVTVFAAVASPVEGAYQDGDFDQGVAVVNSPLANVVPFTLRDPLVGIPAVELRVTRHEFPDGPVFVPAVHVIPVVHPVAFSCGGMPG